MARLVDAPDDNAVEATEELGNLDEMATEQAAELDVQAAEAALEPAVEKEQDDDLPEKYRGKSASEIATMHRELEQRLGQQSQEVGDLRKAFDDMVKQSIAAQQTQSAPEQEADEIDFFTDPQAAVQRAIENHPMLKQSQAVAAEMAKSQALAQLQSAHPDMKEILTDAGFQEWIGKSQVRRELFERADKAYDFAAADELMTLYKERRGIVEQTAKVEKVAQQNEIKKASTGSARSNPDSAKTRKVYRRRDIIELMNRDPKRYEALQPEIMKAYAEGRVK